jgi:hypothetical protein
MTYQLNPHQCSYSIECEDDNARRSTDYKIPIWVKYNNNIFPLPSTSYSTYGLTRFFGRVSGGHCEKEAIQKVYCQLVNGKGLKTPHGFIKQNSNTILTCNADNYNDPSKWIVNVPVSFTVPNNITIPRGGKKSRNGHRTKRKMYKTKTLKSRKLKSRKLKSPKL